MDYTKIARSLIVLMVFASSVLAQNRFARKTQSASYIKSQIHNDARIEAETFLAKFGFQNFEINGSALVDEDYNVLREYPNTKELFNFR